MALRIQLWNCVSLMMIVYIEAVQEETPPHVTSPVSHDMYIVTNNNRFLEINCTADGHPEVSYTWYRNDNPLDEAGPFIKSFKNGSLHLIEFSIRDSGYFQCRAYNIHGVSLSDKFPIFQAMGPEPTLPSSLSVSAQNGETLSLHCVTSSPTIPVYVKRWYHRYHSGKSTEVFLTDRVHVDLNGTLRFAYASTSDSGVYRCGLLGEFAIYFLDFINISVTEGDARERRPKLEFITKEIKGHIDKSVSIECVFSGIPVPEIQWFDHTGEKVNKTTEKFEISKFGHRLTIKQLKNEDEGEFSCVGRNYLGEQVGKLFINVTSPPRPAISNSSVLTSLSTITALESETVTLSCLASHARDELINMPDWFRNGDSITSGNFPDQERYSFNPSRTSLTIKNLKIEEDTACYQCNISNSEGYLFYDGYLRVIKMRNSGSSLYNSVQQLLSCIWFMIFVHKVLII